MENREISILTSVGRGGVDVQVTEANSGHAILSFQLTPAQLFEFITGHSIHLNGDVITRERAAQLGYHHSVFTRTFAAERYAVARAVRDNEIPQSWKTWAENLKSQLWASTVSFGARNNGICVTVRRYDQTPLTDDMRAKVQATLDMATPPEGLLPLTKKGQNEL